MSYTVYGPLVKVENVPLDLFAAKPNPFRVTYSPDAFYLRAEVAKAYQLAVTQFEDKGYTLVGVDAYRPLGIQAQVYNQSSKDGVFVKEGTESNHPKGLAVDVYLEKDGIPLEVQTPLGTWGETSYADRIEGVSDAALNNRKVLQSGMIQAGFNLYNPEWWHFDFPGTAESLNERPEGIQQ